MIFDLRIYTLHNNKFADWLKPDDTAAIASPGAAKAGKV